MYKTYKQRYTVKRANLSYPIQNSPRFKENIHGCIRKYVWT